MTTSNVLQKLASAPSDAPFGVTRHVTVEPGAIRTVGPWLRARGWTAPPLIVCDEATWKAAGQALHGMLPGARAAVLAPRPKDDHLSCEDGAVDRLTEELGAKVTPIAVGAGTLNDLVKLASTRTQKGYLVVPTAASMNGYTSTIAAVLAAGVKRTLAAHQPDAIFADLDVLCAAPAHLNQAGFGDLLSKPFSDADWRLSHIIRGVPYDPGPSRLLDAPYRRLLEAATAVRKADEAGVALLVDTLLVSGFSMAMAGSSAPASGGEHLVSHYWDMEQYCHEEPLLGLHGTQVGIATRLSAMLFERLLALETPPPPPAPPELASLAPQHLMGRHPRLTPSVVAEVLAQLHAKQKIGRAFEEEMAAIRAKWPEIRRVLRESLVPVERITRALNEAGCASRASQIGVDHAHLVRTLVYCREIRARYVGLDLMADLGLLAGWAEEVARASEESE
jgi:glycerol-1-phosphate dehydrogenase [NAD(P)+]